jgi:hypothetical protein
MPIRRRSAGTVRRGAATSSPPISTVPASGRSSPAISRSVVVLPQPLGQGADRPLGNVEVEAVDGDDVAEGLAQAAQAQAGIEGLFELHEQRESIRLGQPNPLPL